MTLIDKDIENNEINMEKVSIALTLLIEKYGISNEDFESLVTGIILMNQQFLMDNYKNSN